MQAAAKDFRVLDTRPFPDVILPTQFGDMVGYHSLSSEQRLMLAVLADAINVVQRPRAMGGARHRVLYDEAWTWIFTAGMRSPLSFDSVCEALGMSANGLRARLLELVRSALKIPLRLRLKEASRMQRVTLNRVRRRARRRVHANPSG
jgi:hypothetical protein